MFVGIDLVGVVEEAETDHVLRRTPGEFRVERCSCGVTFTGADPFIESRAHMREVLVRAALQELSGPCLACRGSGVWRDGRTAVKCPDCDGVGTTMVPLPPMQFRDVQGDVWRVKGARGERALVERVNEN
jgi:hypothetical protein